MAAAWMVEQRGKNEEKQCGSSTRMRRSKADLDDKSVSGECREHGAGVVR